MVRGSRFYELSRRTGCDKMPQSLREAADRSPCGQILGALLLVDDDLLFARVLSRALKRRGFDVQSAVSLTAAQSLLGSMPQPPDFAVLDLNLAGVSSLKLIDPLRQANAECRIVILTGNASVTNAVDAIKLGADQYLAKPIEVDAIVRALLADQEADVESVPEAILSVQRLEWEHIQRVLADFEGNISAAARALRMHRRTLQRKLGKRPGGELSDA
jgi:two-component system response regulator RegA